MAYTKTTFSNGVAPGISETEMNKIGDGIEDAHDDLAAHAATGLPVHGVSYGATPPALTPDNGGSAGSSAAVSRADHEHNIAAGVPETLNPDQSNSEGTSGSFARADHVHNVPAGSPSSIGTALAEGTASHFARSDHVHRVSNMRTVGVTGGTYTDTSPSATGIISPVKVAEFDITMPSGWGSALVVVQANVQYADVDSGAQLQGYLSIDGNTGTTVQSGQGVAGEEAIIAPVHSFVTSDATIDVNLWCQWVGASGGTGKYATFTYMLIRAS